MKYHIYKDDKNEWRWRLVAANGKIIADSGEGYSNKQDCRAGIDLVKNSSSAPVVEDDCARQHRIHDLLAGLMTGGGASSTLPSGRDGRVSRPPRPRLIHNPAPVKRWFAQAGDEVSTTCGSGRVQVDSRNL